MSKPPPIPLIQMPSWIGSGAPEAAVAYTGAVSGVSAGLFVMDPNDLFTEEYMDELVDSEITGAGDGALNSAMEELCGNPSDERVEELLAVIVEARGGDLTMEQAREQYDRFVQIHNVAAEREGAAGEIPDVNTIMHPDFLGSTASLRFGSVVGDAFGLDPVFGAMLSPTGGMVGPGNWAIHPGDDDPTGYHGIVHDAAGYLYNYHGQEGPDGEWQGAGPGYDYLDREGHRDTDNPLSGQQSGMRYWHEKLEPGLATDVKLFAVDVVATTYDGAVAVYDAAADGAEFVYDAAAEGAEVVYDAASDVVEWVGDGLESAGDAVYDAVGTGYEYASDAVSGTIDFFSGLFD